MAPKKKHKKCQNGASDEVAPEDSVSNVGSLLSQPPRASVRVASRAQGKSRSSKKNVTSVDDEVNLDSNSKRSSFVLPGASQSTWDPDAGPKVREVGCQIVCLRCRTDCIPGPEVPLSINSCSSCYGPMPSFHALNMTFAEVCGQCSADENFAEQFQRAVEIMAMEPSARPFPLESITMRKKLGFEVCANFAAKTEDAMKTEDTKGVSAESLGVPLSSIPGPFGSDVDNLVITKDTSMPFLSIKMFSRVEFDDDIVTMSARDRATPDMPAHVTSKLQKVFHDSLPVSLRGNKLPPTMAFLQKKAAGMLLPSEDCKPNDANSSCGVSRSTPLVPSSAASIEKGSSPKDVEIIASKPSSVTLPATPRATKLTHLPIQSPRSDSPAGDTPGKDGTTQVSRATRKGGSYIADKDQAADLIRRLDSCASLNGDHNGTESYAARRFENTCGDEDLVSEVRRARLRYDSADEINANVLEKLDQDFVISILKKLKSMKQDWPIDYALKLVAYRIATSSDSEEIASAADPLPPISDEFDDTEQQGEFDCLTARLSDIAAPEPLARATRFVRLVAKKVITPLLRDNAKALDKIQLLEEAFREHWQPRFDEHKDDPDSNNDAKVIVPFLYEFLDILTFLRMLIDNDIALHEKIYSKIALNKFLAGTLHEAYKPCLLGLEDSKFWGPRIVKFARYRVDEAENAPKIKETIDALNAAKIDDFEATINDSIALGVKVEGVSREQSCYRLWAAVSACMHRYWDSLAFGDEPDEKDLAKANQVDYFFDTAIKKMEHLGDFVTPLRELRGRVSSVLLRLTKVDKSNRQVSALDKFISSPTKTNVDALKEIFFACEEKVGCPHLLDKIRSAMKAARDEAFKRLVGLSPDTVHQPEWSSQMKEVKDMCSMFATQVFHVIGTPTDGDNVEKEWHVTFVSKMSMFMQMADLQNVSTDVGEQVASDEAPDIFQSLNTERVADKRDAWKTRLPFGDGLDWTHESARNMFPSFKALEAFCEPYDNKIDSMLRAFQEEAMRSPIEEVRKLADEVALKAGGMDNGTSYLGEHASNETASYDDIYKVALETVFSNSNRGINKKLQGLRDLANSALKQVVSDASVYAYDLNTHDGWDDMKTKLEKGIGAINTTLAECKVLHNITRDKRTALAARQINVDSVLQQTQATNQKGDVTLRIHSAIKAKAIEFMRA